MSETVGQLLEEARDLLLERHHGNPARSPGHNARLVIEAAITAWNRRAPQGEGIPEPAEHSPASPDRPSATSLNWEEIADGRGKIAADLGARLCLARMAIEGAVDVLANRGRFGSPDDALARLQETLDALRSGEPCLSGCHP